MKIDGICAKCTINFERIRCLFPYCLILLAFNFFFFKFFLIKAICSKNIAQKKEKKSKVDETGRQEKRFFRQMFGVIVFCLMNAII